MACVREKLCKPFQNSLLVKTHCNILRHTATRTRTPKDHCQTKPKQHPEQLHFASILISSNYLLFPPLPANEMWVLGKLICVRVCVCVLGMVREKLCKPFQNSLLVNIFTLISRLHWLSLLSTRCLMCPLHCNTLQHTATHCNTLQHTATHCNTLLDASFTAKSGV